MTEYWVCEGCKSLVRGTADRCYRCRAPRPEEARELEMGISGAVVTPGIDNGLQDVAFVLAEGKRLVPTAVLAWLLVVAVGISVACTLAGIALSVYLEVALLSAGPTAILDPAVVKIALLVGVTDTIASVVGLVLWLIFEGVSLYNAPLLGAGNSRHSIPGALAWWFVPILNIWIPARIVADLHRRLGSKGSPGQLVVGIWWSTFVLSSFFGPILSLILTISAVGFGAAGMLGFSVGINPSLAGVTLGSTLLGVIRDGLLVVSGIAFCTVVLDLHRRQVDRRRWQAEGRERFVASAAAAAAAAAGD